MIKEKKSGQVIVISSPSGGGKGSIINGLLKNDSTTRWLSVSTTTRPQRANDVPGVTYNFVTKEKFEEKIKNGYFISSTNFEIIILALSSSALSYFRWILPSTILSIS